MEAAIFDLLTSQCDRHANNVFVDESGGLSLIDNGDALGRQDLCPSGVLLNSLFHPSSPHHTYATVGRQSVQQNSSSLRIDYPLPHARMDYRCHHGGNIGYNYPPGVKKCLRKFQSTRQEELAQDLGLVDLNMSRILQSRASDMLEKGFEWTLYHGEPQNAEQSQFAPQPPCCKMQKVPDSNRPWWVPYMFMCEDGWKPHLDLYGHRPDKV